MLKSLLVHVSNYTTASVLVTLASVISFPILTRLLSVEEYGVMNLVATALALLVGIGKLGLQHSALRYYSEVRAGKHAAGLGQYEATVAFGMVASALVVAVFWAVVSQWVPERVWNDPRVAPLFLLTAGLIVVRAFDSALINQLRAQERSRAITIYSVARRYAVLILTIGALLLVAGDLWGFYGATVLAETVATVWLAAWMWRRGRPSLKDFDPRLYRNMLVFGLPMIGYELSSVILAMGDRYVIQNLLGPEPLGHYAAAYNLCDYVRAVFLASFSAAVVPMYLRIWEEQGREATLELLHRFLHLYIMVAMLVIAGLSATGGELIGLLASPKYREGAEVIPYVIAGMAFDGLVMVAGAGLYIEKRSKAGMGLVAVCAVLNIALNFLLIPMLGLIGAGVATVASYAALLLLALRMGHERLPVRLPVVAFLKFGAIGLAMYAALMHIEFEHELLTLAARIAAGAVLYPAMVLLADKAARQWASQGWSRLTRGHAGAIRAELP
ncbi:oligosaccharide flippase family protein [Caldimonas aquatica]|uniref:Oligosaccharide flippase family protein n=1 Tax=Caldimonas aquatica TaxID=376175 RepID=A0ABY6MW03_9BURK|nr:oligosaccharide flippase family protein [Schlegelella aquatica]UZD56186.1 oligosaccharide flippase family protein [Schlegelella aquatica]